MEVTRKRPLKPRGTDALQVVPPAITDRTAPALVGLEGRAFRAWLRTAGVPHTRIGARVVARTVDVLEALGRAAAAPVSGVDLAQTVDEEQEDAQPTDERGVLAALGLRAAGAR